MNEKIGEVFSIKKDNRPAAGCTISKAIVQDPEKGIVYFTMAEDTDISAETYSHETLYIVHEGEVYMCIRGDREDMHKDILLNEGDMIISPADIPVGFRSVTDCVFTEINFGKDFNMNKIINSGEIFELKDLLPYEDGKIVNMDIVHNDKMKFVIMSFDDGCALSEHSAPGDAVVFCIEGNGVITYEGKENPITAGEQFVFAKNGLHAVKANGRFKMALLLVLE
ncbi:MAG: cupin domain-containing protein [Clostridiales bacterium]|nr:cupin domain-containing protein [Clostridiales bacterium]MBS5877523.1 cupin domain-containing protein [Clostridiales bacterium]MDU0938909.1 cupin domain-containing protein [Clostridiales bacterium]MDU1041451.1 cupin domain-containing protein [Clostridiales bacterium]